MKPDNMKFDPTKPVQLRGGRKARIIATDLAGPRPIVVAYSVNGMDCITEYLFSVHKDGRLGSGYDDHMDLVNIPEEKVVYRNVWKEARALSHDFDSYDEAKKYQGDKQALAILKIVYRDEKLHSMEFASRTYGA